MNKESFDAYEAEQLNLTKKKINNNDCIYFSESEVEQRMKKFKARFITNADRDV